MAQFLMLEDFDEQARRANAVPSDPVESLPGYDAGFAAGEAAAQSAQANIDAALVQTLNDMAFGFAEARQHLLQGIRPLFAALIDQLLPSVVDDAFRARLVDTLQQIAKDQSEAPVRLIVDASQAEAMTALLPAIQGLDITLLTQDDLGPHGALISYGDAECALDLDDLIAQVITVLGALFDITDQPEESSKHG